MSNEVLFSLTNRVFIVTGGAGFLAEHFSTALLSAGASTVLLDNNEAALSKRFEDLKSRFPSSSIEPCTADVTSEGELRRVNDHISKKYGQIDGLVNNAANNPVVTSNLESIGTERFENLTIASWDRDIAVGLTGTMLCSKIFGQTMSDQGKGTIVNISSDLGLISPDQRLYEIEGLAPEEQPVKPLSYSVIKTGLIGLTRYLATYWATRNVRVNTLCLGGVENGQSDIFLERVSERIPLGRLAKFDEHCGSLLYLCSDASSYVTGSTVTCDGGRTIW